MKRNSRLSLALHALGHMANDPARTRTSADIAEHAGTNPFVVRRVFGKLREAGILSSEKGHAGGWRLARPSEAISLADFYLSLDKRLVAGNTTRIEPTECSVETNLQRKVSELLAEVELTLVDRLRETSINDIHSASCSYCAD